MRELKLPVNLPYRFKRDDSKFYSSEYSFCRLIENVGGVPFKLIFGAKPGEGHYLDIGTGIKQLLGVSPEDFSESLFNGMVAEIIPLIDGIPSDTLKAREKFISGEIKIYKAEVLIMVPGGEKKWIQDSSLPLIEEETGKVIGAYGILFDINEGKRNLISLEKAMLKAEESDRLKSAFLTNLSHEIRTPLNAIVGFSTLLIENDSDPESRNEFMDIITRSTDHLLEIMDNIVEISNFESNSVKVNKEEIRIDLVIRKIYDQFVSTAKEKNVTLLMKCDSEENELKLRTDGSKLMKVMVNLLNNAMKFTREGKVELGYTVNDLSIEFFVADTGIGIAPEHHERIFNRFYQADSSYTRRFEGTGLGLSISKAYVELLGGEIWFNSSPGIGSVFYFTIPNIS